MSEDTSILKMVSEISELNEIHLYFQDEDVDKALEFIIRMIAKPDVPPGKAAPLIVQLQALSTKFALMGKVHMLYDLETTKEEKARKKNTLLTLSAELEKLSNALKYLVK